MLPESSTGLYWSIRGHVACNQHAPLVEDPRWGIEGWAPPPSSSQNVRSQRYQCQYCSPEQTALVHAKPDDPSTPSQGA
jgi:hypothetical protein